MSMQQPLTPELEAKAQELLTHLRSRTEEDLLALARLLVSKEDHEIFGETEFQARDIVHRIARKPWRRTSLKKKPRLRRLRRRLPRAANKRPNSTGYRRVKAAFSLMGPVPCVPLITSAGVARVGVAVGRSGRPDGSSVHAEAAEKDRHLGKRPVSDSFSGSCPPGSAGNGWVACGGNDGASARPKRWANASAHLCGGRTFGLFKPWGMAAGCAGAYLRVHQPGPDGRAAAGCRWRQGGRAACRTWRWSTIRCRSCPRGSPYRTPPKAVKLAKRWYLSGLVRFGRIGIAMRKQAGQVGMNRAEVWIGLTDGGNLAWRSLSARISAASRC